MVEGLVDEVPDKAATIRGVALQVCVVVEAANRVTHRMHVFARQVGLRGIIAQVLFNRVRKRIHARFNIRGVIELSIPRDALVVDRAGIVQLVAAAIHGSEDLATERLITQRPHQDGRVIAILAQHRLDAVHAGALPLHL